MKDSELIFALLASLGSPGLDFRQVRALTIPMGISETNLRSVLSRMNRHGSLMVERNGRRASYSLSAAGRTVSHRVSRRFREPNTDQWDGRFVLVAFSHATGEREERYRLRKVLAESGFRPLFPGFWIRPRSSEESYGSLLEPWTGNGRCRWTEGPLLPELGADEADRLWDLTVLNRRMKAVAEDLGRGIKDLAAVSVEEAFRMKFLLGDQAAKTLAEDPLLPPYLLPSDWSARLLRETFLFFDEKATEASRPFWERILRDQEV